MIFWRIRYWLQDRYLKRKYSNKEPGVYYDRRYKTYVSSTKPTECGSIQNVVEELTGYNLYFSYHIGNYKVHSHSYDGVLKDAYNHALIFSLDEDDMKDYSAQELEWLRRAKEVGAKHSKEYERRAIEHSNKARRTDL